MFALIRQFQELNKQELYNWEDQERDDWQKFHDSMSGGFCSGSGRHCHWGAFYHYWDDHFYGVISTFQLCEGQGFAAL